MHNRDIPCSCHCIEIMLDLFQLLGFTFWNWPEFKEDFINEFKREKASDINDHEEMKESVS